MEIVSGQQKDRAFGRVANEFNLSPFGSPQLFQMLENKNSGWGKFLKMILGSLVLVKEAFTQPSHEVKSSVTGYFSNKESLLFLAGMLAVELCL